MALTARARILVVEDDPAVGDVFRQFLPMKGYDVEVVTDAESALDVLTKADFDLVVADKNLPGVSGIELLKRVKSHIPDLDVIIMTAYADMSSALEAIAAGVYDYLVKPFDSLEDVARTIDRAVEKRRIVSENRRLIVSLTEANRQIDGLNQNLEKQIAERTRQLEEANGLLAQLTITDDVTGLFNQRFLYGRLAEEFARAKRHHHSLAVMMLDIDFFKAVNDSHDHIFGSQVLKRVGLVVRSGLRSIDMLIRYGGDEFVVVMPETSLKEALPIAERLRALVEKADVGDTERPYRVTVSVGVAALDDSPADSASMLLRCADKAMYVAKNSGKNLVVPHQAPRDTSIDNPLHEP